MQSATYLRAQGEIMKVFDLREPMDPPNGWQEEYLNGFEFSRDQGFIRYQMEFDYDVRDGQMQSYVFMTGSKDVWLRLGALLTSCHTNMVELLEVEFNQRHIQIIPLHFDDKGPVLVSRTQNPNGEQVQYLFASAR
jgi:hypothetical protein